MGKFAEIAGNENVKQALVGMVDGDRIPHAIMFHENDGCGALHLALTFLQYVMCGQRDGGEPCGVCPSCQRFSRLMHPDVHFTFPITSSVKVNGKVSGLVCDDFLKHWRELLGTNRYFLESDVSEALGFEKKKGQILVSEGHSILQTLSISPSAGEYRGIVIYLPELMNVSTANMLLKAIEEPYDKTIFILITHSPEDVLMTISSRCQNIRLLPLEKAQVKNELVRRYNVSAEDADMAASISFGSVGLALRELTEKEDVVEMKAVLKDLLQALADRDLLSALEAGEKVAAMESREKQKLFCNFAGGMLRNIFLVQQGMETVANMSDSDVEFVRGLALKFPKTFSRNGLLVFSKAGGLIDRNVAQKIVFANLVGHLYQSLYAR